MNRLDKEYLEKIPPADLREIIARVHTQVKNLFEDAERLGLPRSVYCSECHPAERRLQYVISDVQTGKAWCMQHYLEKKEREACEEYLVEHLGDRKLKEPFPVAETKYGGLVPLDVEDFARI